MKSLLSLRRSGALLAILIVLAACSGTTQQPAQTQTPVPPTAQQVAQDKPTPAPACPDPKQAETVVRQFFVSLNSYKADLAIGFLAPDIRLYADGATGFVEDKHNMDNIKSYLIKMAGLHDQFVITAVNARVEPSPRTIEYYVEMKDVVRVNDDLSASKKLAKGTITLNVHCDTLKIAIIGISTRPQVQ